jgi:nucleoside-diphosphate-sugar epimerase
MPIPELKSVPVLVTGGAGFIGSHLVDALVERGATVRVLDNFSTGRRLNLAHVMDRVKIMEGDIRDLDVCRNAAEGVEVVFHQAAIGSVPRSMKDPSATFAANVQGTMNVFAACRDAGVIRIVYASSSSVYGDSAGLPKREGEEGEPLSPYALSKLVGEEIAAMFARCYGLEAVGLRYFNVYGPRQDPLGAYAAVIPRFFRAALRGEPLVIYGDGLQSRDFTFVEDAVRANLLAAGAPAETACGAAYNVAGGAQTTVIELARLIGEASGQTITPVHDPPRQGDVLHSLADLSLSESGLGYKAKTGLSEGLLKSLSFYKRDTASVPPGEG